MLFIAAIEVFIFMLIIEGLRKHSTGLSLWLYRYVSGRANKLEIEIEDTIAKRKALKDQQSEVSLQDEFAKYMKLDRQIIACDANIKKLQEQSSTMKSSILKRTASIIWWTSIVLYLILMYFYKRTPIFYLPPSLTSPLSEIMAFRSGAEVGAISGIVWIFVCRRIAAVIYTGL